MANPHDTTSASVSAECTQLHGIVDDVSSQIKNGEPVDIKSVFAKYSLSYRESLLNNLSSYGAEYFASTPHYRLRYFKSSKDNSFDFGIAAISQSTTSGLCENAMSFDQNLLRLGMSVKVLNSYLGNGSYISRYNQDRSVEGDIAANAQGFLLNFAIKTVRPMAMLPPRR